LISFEIVIFCISCNLLTFLCVFVFAKFPTTTTSQEGEPRLIRATSYTSGNDLLSDTTLMERASQIQCRKAMSEQENVNTSMDAKDLIEIDSSQNKENVEQQAEETRPVQEKKEEGQEEHPFLALTGVLNETMDDNTDDEGDMDRYDTQIVDDESVVKSISQVLLHDAMQEEDISHRTDTQDTNKDQKDAILSLRSPEVFETVESTISNKKNSLDSLSRNTIEKDADQPDLIPSNTEESEEDLINMEENPLPFKTFVPAIDAGHQARPSVLDSSNFPHEDRQRRENIAHLLRYKNMVQQQEAEEIATMNYMRPLLQRLEKLAKRSSCRSTSKNDCSDLCKNSISFLDMKRAVSVLESQQRNNHEFMVQDKQLMMILRMLTEKYHGSKSEDVSITWAEFIHCYRICVMGMLTLKELPKRSDVRTRTKSRILSQLSTFEHCPPTPMRQQLPRGGNGEHISTSTPTDDYSPSQQLARHANSKHKLKVAAALAFSVFVGFLAGKSFPESSLATQPVSHSESCLKQTETSIVPANMTEKFLSVEQYPPFLSESSNTNLLSEALILAHTGRVGAVMQKKLIDFHKLSAATLIHTTASMIGTPAISKAGDHESCQDLQGIYCGASAHSKPKLWRLVPSSKYKLAISVVLGASAPQIFLLIRRIAAGAISLGNFGLIPASLVVVGAVAVVSKVIQFAKMVLRVKSIN